MRCCGLKFAISFSQSIDYGSEQRHLVVSCRFKRRIDIKGIQSTYFRFYLLSIEFFFLKQISLKLQVSIRKIDVNRMSIRIVVNAFGAIREHVFAITPAEHHVNCHRKGGRVVDRGGLENH